VPTLYTRTGDIVPLVALAFCALAVVRVLRARRVTEIALRQRQGGTPLLAVILSLAAAQASAAAQAVIPLEPYLRSQSVVRAAVHGHVGTFLFDTGEGVSTISPAFAKDIGCQPWGRITGFRMTGERLDLPHCDEVTFELSGQSMCAPAVGLLDIMALLGPDAPRVDGSFGLDLFAGRVITLVPRKAIIVESAASLASRLASARELPIRLVRDSEGIALSVNGAVRTTAGTAWMELDTGNGGSLIVANHIAPLLGLGTDLSTPTPARFELANGIVVEGAARTRDLTMDGNIGAQFLNAWALTLDLDRGRAWLSPTPRAPQ
jgi:hypothetical protein